MLGIPETQLDTWASQGSIKQSADTYGIIKNALESTGRPYADKASKVFLQGSYGNDTNVFRDSDVDVVIRMDAAHYRDTTRMTPPEVAAYNQAYPGGGFTLPDFKKLVVQHLYDKFPNCVMPGNKAVEVLGNQSGRRDADVLVCAQLRRYYGFTAIGNERYVEGICFFLPDGTRVDNFPERHSANCSLKHQKSGANYKPMVRIFKNMRNKMIEDRLIQEGLAPSYFIEGMLYNVPNGHFTNNYGDTFVQCFSWLQNTDRSTLLCAHGLDPLLAKGSRTAWDPDHCTKFLEALAGFWNSWGKVE